VKACGYVLGGSEGRQSLRSQRRQQLLPIANLTVFRATDFSNIASIGCIRCSAHRGQCSHQSPPIPMLLCTPLPISLQLAHFTSINHHKMTSRGQSSTQSRALDCSPISPILSTNSQLPPKLCRKGQTRNSLLSKSTTSTTSRVRETWWADNAATLFLPARNVVEKSECCFGSGEKSGRGCVAWCSANRCIVG
jgi:hypothetical protein